MRKFIALGMVLAITAVAAISQADAHVVVAVLDSTRHALTQLMVG